ncbi:MAG: thiol reductant ABC exporter subunit CydC [Negativicutes bacterium]|jgi:thiol reductant ABC exporter CydC subunit
MTRLLRLIIPVWPAMLVSILLTVFTIASNIGLMGVSAFLIAMAALHPPIAAISTAIVGVRFFGIARAVSRYCERCLSHDTTFRLLSRLRVLFYQAIEPLVPARSGLYRSGDLLSRMANDVDSLQFFYLRVVAPPAAAVIILVGMVYWLSQYSEQFALILLGGFMAAGLILPLLVKYAAGSAAAEAARAKGQLTALVVDSVQGAAELIAFGRADAQVEKVRVASEQLNRVQRQSAYAAALADSLSGFIGHLSAWLVLLLAVPMVRNGVISGVDLAVLVLVIESSFEAVQPLAMLLLHAADSRQAADRLFSVTDTPPAVSEGGAPIAPAGYSIEFNNVSFAYNEQDSVLSNLSFKVQAGRRLAIVGESGAGKSSIVGLLLRFWDYQSGSIELDGRPLKVYQPAGLRELFSVVAQTAYLFNASIKDNILLAKPNATQQELDQAIQAASLTTFVENLPDKINTIVGENGRSLSGGQRQRIAIARALLKGAPVLVLDEPTSGLDPVTEREVMADIKKVMAGRTTILITHRLVGLESMDEILVLNKGTAAEHGTQADLLARQGLFYKMWKQQKDMLE